jgi:4-hydroxy-tetrahydrodipicolinate synthase
MLPETVARIAEIDNIIGVKEATGQLDRITRLRELTAPDFAIYSGDDATAREAILRGANGDISVTANVAPAAMHAMCAAALAGDSARAAEIDAKLAGLHARLFLESNPIPVKWAVAEMGLIERGIRLPLTWFSENFHDQLRAAMRQAGTL